MCRSTGDRGLAAQIGYRYALFLILLAPGRAALGQEPELAWARVGSPAGTSLQRCLLGFDSRGGLVMAASGYAFSGHNSSGTGMAAAQVAMRFRPSGKPDWTMHYAPDAAARWATIDATEVDSSDSVFTVGTFYRPAPNGGPELDFFVQKLDATGRRIWSDHYDGGSFDLVTGAAPDNRGGAIVAGSSYLTIDGAVRRAMTTIRYNDAGSRMWVAHHAEPGDDSTATAVVADGAGGAYVLGYAGMEGRSRAIVVHYDADGRALWETSLGGAVDSTGRTWASAAAGAVDRQGALTLCVNALAATEGFTVLKYNANGRMLWRVDERLAGCRATVFRMEADRRGNLFVGASVHTGRSAYAVYKYAPDGRRAGRSLHNARAGEALYASDLAVDRMGNIYVTGVAYTPTGNPERHVTVKLDASGAHVWRFDYGSTRKTMLDLPRLAVSRRQEVAVTGMVGWWSGKTFVREPAMYLLR